MRIYSIHKSLVWLGCLLAVCACSTVRDVQPKQQRTAKPVEALTVYELASPIPEHLIATEKSLQQQIAAQPDDINLRLRLAALYRHLEQYELAENIVQRALVLSGNDVAVQNEMAILQRNRGQFEAARQTYVEILHAHPDFYTAHYNLGILFDLYLQQPAQALVHYSAYLDAAPEADARVSKWLADLQRRYDLEASTSMVSANE